MIFPPDFSKNWDEFILEASSVLRYGHTIFYFILGGGGMGGRGRGLDLRPVCKLKFVNYGPDKKKHSTLSIPV